MQNPTPGRHITRRTLLATGAVCAGLGAAAGALRPGDGEGSDGDEGDVEPGDAPVGDAPIDTPDGESGITTATIAEAEKLAGLAFDGSERAMLLDGAIGAVAVYRKRRAVHLDNGDAPAGVFRTLPAAGVPTAAAFVRSDDTAGPPPASDEDLAFAPVTSLARWIERGALSSERLTTVYLDRLRRVGPRLECVVTLTDELALAQARRADAEIAAGRYRGPLHGIPWGAKDLFDTAGIRTTWGAVPFRDRVPDTDAEVVRRLEAAGAVLVAKLSLGALAYGDIWFGGRTRNPWNTNQGSSGSSAGSAAATAAGLVGFSLGTETLGSIVSPSMRCGTTGLRPTFGRVPRSGAMALCWSLDKIGPICRTVEDTALVLAAICGAHPGDASSVDRPLHFDAAQSVATRRVGYDTAWFEGRRATALDRSALDALRRTGVELVKTSLPDLPYDVLRTILEVEAAAAFEELTLSGRDDDLTWQEPRAWPNTFRRTWFVPAVELVQAQRFRRRVCTLMAERFDGLDAMFGPSFASSMLLITNNTGHPSLTLRAGVRSNDRPHGVTLWGRPFDEGTLCRLGMALERELDVWHLRPGV